MYRAQDTRLQREVAVKVLPAELASDAERLKRFEKEARSASALNHPNIVTIYDIGSEGGVSYIAMEKVEGTTLRELLALERQGRLKILLDSNISSLEAAGERIRVTFDTTGIAPLEVDNLIHALGGTTPENFLKSIGIAFDGPSPRLTESFGTSVPGLFLVGDLTVGKKGGSIILAFNSSAAAMRQICEDHGICGVTRNAEG